MEDSHTTELQLDEDNRTRNAFFAVYDGHGGMWLPVIVCGVTPSHIIGLLFLFERKQVRALPSTRATTSSNVWRQNRHIKTGITRRL